MLHLALLFACAHGGGDTDPSSDTDSDEVTDTCPPPTDASECLPTWGDQCSCERQCMTQCQLDEITEVCDLGCFDSGGWSCVAGDDGACAVEP